MTALATRTIQKTKPSLSLFQRIAAKDKTAVQECLDTYGNLVWSLARKSTDSTADAEAATEEIFLDIWRCAEHGDKIRLADNLLIALIARRRLNKRLPSISQTKSMVSIEAFITLHIRRT